MEEIVLKRTASVTSAEALDQINSAYPEAEILSFRRIKEIGNDSEFFVARLRVAQTIDEDVIVEGQEHEQEEEAMMKELLRLVRQLVEKDDKSDNNPSKDDHEAKPLPQPQRPPFGVNEPGSEIVPIVASIVVEREADVPKSIARIELIKEFGKEYRISEINKKGNVFQASLIKMGEEEGENPYRNPFEKKTPEEETEEMLRAEESRTKKPKRDDGVEDKVLDIAEQMRALEENEPQRDEFGATTRAQSRPRRDYAGEYRLHKWSQLWLDFLYEKGISLSRIAEEEEKLSGMAPKKQKEYVQSYVSEAEDFQKTRDESYQQGQSEKRKREIRKQWDLANEVAQMPAKPNRRATSIIEKIRGLEPEMQLPAFLQALEKLKEISENNPEDTTLGRSLIQALMSLDVSEEKKAQVLMDLETKRPGFIEQIKAAMLGEKIPPAPREEKDLRVPTSPSFGVEPGKDFRSQRLQLPEDARKDFVKWFNSGKPSAEVSRYDLHSLNENIQSLVQDARQKIFEHFVKGLDPNDSEYPEAEKAARERTNEAIDRILHGSSQRKRYERIRRYRNPDQPRWLEKEVAEIIGAPRVKIDPTKPMWETVSEYGSEVSPLQVYNVMQDQMRQRRVKNLKQPQPQEPMVQEPQITEQEVNRPEVTDKA